MIDNKILEFLSLFDDEYIISLSNKGYLKRSKKDYDKIKGEIKVINESPLELELQDNKVAFNDNKVQDIVCTCPDSKFCRHRIISIFYVQENFSISDSSDDLESKQEINPIEKYKELLEFDLKSLEKKFTKAKFIKGVKFFLSSNIKNTITNNSLDFIFNNDFNDEVIKFSFKSVLPLENNNCDNTSCKGQKSCIHNVASMLSFLTQENVIAKAQISDLIKKDLTPIDDDLLKDVENVFLEIINEGLTRITTATATRIKKLSFKIHYEIPAFEKLMNGVQRDLNSFINKSPKFDLVSFRNKIIRFFRILRLYQVDTSNYKMIDSLTRFRSEYTDVKEVVLYGVGQEYIEVGDNAILKTYFLSKDNKVFHRSIFLSLKSGVTSSYDYTNPRSKLLYMPLWEGLVSEAFNNKKTILKKTKINSENYISSVVSTVSLKENHNFEGLFSYINFKDLKEEYLKHRKKNALLSINYRAFYSLIKPDFYYSPVFDYETQHLTIDISDIHGNIMSLRFRYGDVPKRYQNNRKQVFDRIISEFNNEKKSKPSLIFGTPYIENRKLYINVISFFYNDKSKLINPNIDWEIKESK